MVNPQKRGFWFSPRDNRLAELVPGKLGCYTPLRWLNSGHNPTTKNDFRKPQPEYPYGRCIYCGHWDKEAL